MTSGGLLKQTKTAPANTRTRYLFLTSASGSQARYAGLDLTPTTGSMGATTVQVKGGAQCTTTDPADTVNRCFEVAPTTSQTANLRFYFLDGEKDSQIPANVLPWHWSAGAGWNSAGTVSSRGLLLPDIYWIQADGVNAFSPFALSAKINGPTAVTFLGLSARSAAGAGLPLAALVAVLGIAALFWISKRRSNRTR